MEQRKLECGRKNERMKRKIEKETICMTICNE